MVLLFFLSRGETARHCDGDEGTRKPRFNRGAMNEGREGVRDKPRFNRGAMNKRDAVITSIMNNEI